MALSSKKKPTLLLIHGLRGDHHGFAEMEKYLARDFEVLNRDIPGSGDEPELDQHDLNGYVEFYHNLVSNLPEKPVVVAHSMGTIIASHYVTKYPEDTQEKLVLVSPIVRGKAQERTSPWLYGLLRGALVPFPKTTKKKILASRQVSWVISHFLTCDKSMQKEIDQKHYEYSGRFSSAKSLLSDIKISTTMSAVIPGDKDVLIIMGKEDRLVRAEVVGGVAKEKKASYVEVLDTGHLINYEKPEAVARAIQEFVAG